MGCLSVILLSKGGGYSVVDKMCISERRTRILQFLAIRKQSTYAELADEFHVSINTINRDINYLSDNAPIYTKSGNRGGVYLHPEYRSYKNYLTEEEERCLYGLIDKASDYEKKILRRIIIKFTRHISLK